MVPSDLAVLLLVMPVVVALVALPNKDSFRLFLRVQRRFCDNRLSLRQQGRSEKDDQEESN
jgi:hypothetical protein